jgi:transcriptional regulator with XRE-family HTH domain
MTFGQQLRSKRQDLGLSQTEVAALLEVSLSSVQKWELDMKTPKLVMQEGIMARLATFSRFNDPNNIDNAT